MHMHAQAYMHTHIYINVIIHCYVTHTRKKKTNYFEKLFPGKSGRFLTQRSYSNGHPMRYNYHHYNIWYSISQYLLFLCITMTYCKRYTLKYLSLKVFGCAYLLLLTLSNIHPWGVQSMRLYILVYTYIYTYSYILNTGFN